MKVIATLASVALLATSSLAVTVSFDNVYDDPNASPDITACGGTGPNGLSGKFPTFGSMPTFPRIGGAQAVDGFDSVNCGTCWALTFNGTTINVLAVDHADSGFNIAQGAMDDLTNNQAVKLGIVDATVVQMDKSACGL